MFFLFISMIYKFKKNHQTTDRLVLLNKISRVQEFTCAPGDPSLPLSPGAPLGPNGPGFPGGPLGPGGPWKRLVIKLSSDKKNRNVLPYWQKPFSFHTIYIE